MVDQPSGHPDSNVGEIESGWVAQATGQRVVQQRRQSHAGDSQPSKKDADMNNMTATLKTHPLAVGSDGYKNFLFLEGKVNSTNMTS